MDSCVWLSAAQFGDPPRTPLVCHAWSLKPFILGLSVEHLYVCKCCTSERLIHCESGKYKLHWLLSSWNYNTHTTCTFTHVFRHTHICRHTRADGHTYADMHIVDTRAGRHTHAHVQTRTHSLPFPRTVLWGSSASVRLWCFHRWLQCGRKALIHRVMRSLMGAVPELIRSSLSLFSGFLTPICTAEVILLWRMMLSTIHNGNTAQDVVESTSLPRWLNVMELKIENEITVCFVQLCYVVSLKLLCMCGRVFSVQPYMLF